MFFMHLKWPLFNAPCDVDVGDVDKALMDGIMYAAAFASSSPEKFSTIAPPWPFPPPPLMQWILCVCVHALFVSRMWNHYRMSAAAVSQLSYELSPLRLMTDTWWPLLRMDVWLLTHFWLPLHWFFYLFIFQTYSSHRSVYTIYIYMYPGDNGPSS